MEQKKQKIATLLNSYSPKQLKSYLSGASINNYTQESNSGKNTPNNRNPFQKKSISPTHIHSSKPITSSISRSGNSSRKLTLKSDSEKKYLLNYNTTTGTPFEKSALLSYFSTPNEKSLDSHFNTVNSTMDKLNRKMKKIKTSKKFLTKDQQHFPSTQQETLSEKSVKVKFLINCHNKSDKISQKIVYKKFACFASFSSMKKEFLSDKQCLNERTKASNYGFFGFETLPYDHQIIQLINNQSEATFQELIRQQIRQLTLVPIYLKKKINYENLEFKHFEVLNYLGSGGFSSVYLAKCLIDQQMCALKFIKKDTITSAKKIRMLENEKNILFTISHPNLIDLYYAFQTRNYIVFGLEYCPNGNLFNLLQRTKGLNQVTVKHLFKQILDGLEYLHENNILFRDIKLQNILFDEQGNIKITDFGLSKPDISEEDITYSYCGSPEYMAPEMLSKEGHSFGVDYYALGILLYELFYAKSPFYAPKKEDIFVAILSSDPVFPKTPAISREAKALIKGLLAKNPKHRIGSLKGIKQIKVHPWLKSANFSPEKDRRISKNNRRAQYQEESFERRKQVVSNQRDQHSKHEKRQNLSQNILNMLLSGANKISLQNDPRRIKETFDEEKLSSQNERCFFEQSFVNRNLLEKIERQIVRFNPNNSHDHDDRKAFKNLNQKWLNNFGSAIPGKVSRSKKTRMDSLPRSSHKSKRLKKYF